ncbi:hypothetical protein [Streptomyces sp. S1]
MSEERILWIFAEKRMVPVDEGRELEVLPDARSLDVQDEERVLEVLLP